jgi:hypothetical protein
METQMKQIIEALDSFFKRCDSDVVETMESMLYDWYQHYALEHYEQEHITEVVNGAFRVNDLLLNLREAICTLRDGEDISQDPLGEEYYDYRFAS